MAQYSWAASLWKDFSSCQPLPYDYIYIYIHLYIIIYQKIYQNIYISEDHYLNPLVRLGRSYIKDIYHFLSKLGEMGRIPEGAILCTVDVVGLYPSIPHVEDLEAIREALDRRAMRNHL